MVDTIPGANAPSGWWQDINAHTSFNWQHREPSQFCQRIGVSTKADLVSSSKSVVDSSIGVAWGIPLQQSSASINLLKHNSATNATKSWLGQPVLLVKVTRDLFTRTVRFEQQGDPRVSASIPNGTRVLPYNQHQYLLTTAT